VNLGNFDTAAQCFDACYTHAEAEGQRCTQFIYGRRGNYGACLRSKGACSSYEPNSDWTVFDMTTDPAVLDGASGAKYSLRKAGVECSGESAEHETILGYNFANIGECFDACDRAARL